MEFFFYFPIAFMVYLVVAFILFGMIRSISATYKELTGWLQLIPILVMLFGIAIPFSAIGFQLAADHHYLRWLWILGGAVITLVGSAPVINSKLTERAHIVGATVGMGIYVFAAVLTLPGLCPKLIMLVFLLFLFTQTAHDMLQFSQKAPGWVNSILKPLFWLANKAVKFKLKNNTYWIEVVWGTATFLALFVTFKMLYS